MTNPLFRSYRGPDEIARAKARFLELVRAGLPMMNAYQEAQIYPSTITRWRDVDPSFAAALLEARAARGASENLPRFSGALFVLLTTELSLEQIAIRLRLPLSAILAARIHPGVRAVWDRIRPDSDL